MEKDALWVKAINSKYGVTSSKWLPTQLNNQNSFSKIWGDICQVGKEGANLEMIIAEGFWIKVGSGQQTSFWKDVWCGNQALRDAYPRLFRKSNQKNSTVEEMYDSSNLVWDLTFSRRLFTWENEELYELKLNLNTITLQPNVNDSLCWRWVNQTNSFSVKSCYEKWEDDFNSQNHIGPLCRRIWKNLCPFKVEVFVWQALQDKVATGSELKKRNVLNQEDTSVGLCPFCSLEVETVPHLFLRRTIPWRIWSTILDWWGNMWVCPSSLYELLCGGSPINSNRWKKGVGKSVSMLSSGPYGLKEIIFCSETKLAC